MLEKDSHSRLSRRRILSQIRYILLGLKGAALCFSTVTGPIAADADMLGSTSLILIVNTFHSVTGHFQSGLRRFEQICENASPVLIKACTAGIIYVLSLSPIYCNRGLTAAIIGVVHTGLYTTFQLRHGYYLLVMVFILPVRRFARCGEFTFLLAAAGADSPVLVCLRE